METECQSGKLASDMKAEVGDWILSFGKSIIHTDFQRHLLNDNRDQTTNVSTVRRWQMCFLGGDADINDKPRSTQRLTQEI